MNLFFLSLLLSSPCEDIGVLRVILFIKNLLNYLFTLIPFGVVLFLSIDFFKNVASSSEEQKKNFTLFIKRCIYLVLVFLVPTIVSLVVGFFEEDIDNTIGSYSKCLEVTSENIEELVSKEKEGCLDDYEWDSLNNICVYVGGGWESIDTSKFKKDINPVVPRGDSDSKPSSNPGSRTMVTYSQRDSRWTNVGFCSGGKTIGGSGCGATALASIITGYGNDPNATPKTVRDFLCDNKLHYSGGLNHDTPVNSKLLDHFGLTGSIANISNKSSSYSESVASKLKEYIDNNYGVIMLVPGHFVAVDKGGCSADKVYYYDGTITSRNGCMTMRDLWNVTYNRWDRCTSNGRCGWEIVYLYKSK